MPYSHRTFWLAEGQSSQRDMLLSLRALKARYPLTLIASHRDARPEITTCADLAYQEPEQAGARIAYVLEQARAHGVSLLLAGRNSRDYEVQRQAFADAGIRVLTGATSCAALDIIEDKSRFIAHCLAQSIPVAGGWVFRNLDELEQLLARHGDQPLCVKPVNGIFAQGFWRLDTGEQTPWDSFAHLYFTDARKIHLDAFLHAYRQSDMVHSRPIPMLLMPYLPGREYSMDVVCEQGEILLAITRYKQGSVQTVGCEAQMMDLLTPLIRSLGCDGIISVQSKGDSAGVQHVLEINSRPSGGIGYSVHCGIDLTQLAFAYWNGWIDQDELAAARQRIQPCTVRPFTTSVRID